MQLETGNLAVWMAVVKPILKYQNLDWLIDNTETPDITAAIRDKAEVAISFVVMEFLPEKMQARLPEVIEDITIRRLLELIDRKLRYKSDEHPDEL